eukprot:CAMPEP_0173385842 /NCGR_PEP_ID=MMETSP1356-20130122/8439_1 /TAXON_ID=77927 ORGANISM="Hemiselmis virescens, Strain PCC157" /NCGR_SAMPLE_ID=MMETSP1356 /ASSEMBLY_ACC=CAM_ASM_000847 /LENGTH=611 /DNA_ID=CAMNT_0014341827 /DNA_START=74 /DNA_END=1906 /DNA_ORIENTATION=-
METEGFVSADNKDRMPEEDEEDNDDWSDLERFQNFMTSQHPLRRLVCVRGLAEMVHCLSVEDALEGALPMLEQAAADEESSVRDALASQLAPALKDLLPRAQPNQVAKVVALVWPLSVSLLQDRDQQVRAVAEDAVIEYAPLLPRDLIESPVLECVVQMSHDGAEEHRITAMKLLGELSFALGPDLVMRGVAPEVITLAEDAMFRVRKCAALYIGKVARWSAKGYAISDLFPVYLALAEDEIWGVRKACAESMSDVAASLTPDVRQEKLLPLVETFTSDVSRWVRNAAFQHLGPLIATLSAQEVTPNLLSLYSSMAMGKGNGGAGDNEMPNFCAYNFPAVVLAVGREGWPMLQEAYHELVKDIQWKVRRTLSFSMHEIALILGPELTASSLLGAMDVFLKDLDEVKIGVLQNLSKILGVLEPSARASYVELICSLEMESDNWRFRHLLAVQLGELFALFGEEVVETELYPIFVKLLRDPVAEVRNGAAQQLGQILKRLKELEGAWKEEFMAELSEFATDDCFQARLTYAFMCDHLVRLEDYFDAESFEKDFLPQLVKLSTDKVTNIRRLVGNCIVLLRERKGFTGQSDVKLCVEQLSKDTDIDVLRTMGKN